MKYIRLLREIGQDDAHLADGKGASLTEGSQIIAKRDPATRGWSSAKAIDVFSYNLLR